MDEIQRKLALIDEQLARGGLRRRLVSTAPLFFPAVGLMTGIVVQDRLVRPLTGPDSLPILGGWLIVMTAVAGALGVYFIRRRHDPQPEVFACGALLAFACLGAIRLLAYEKADPRDIRRGIGPDRVLATVRGRVLTPPVPERQDWGFAELVPADPSSAFYLELERVRTAAGWQPAVGTIRVQVDEPVPNLHVGDSIQAYCWLHRFEEPTNPGQFNFARYLRLRNVFVGASVPAREAIETLKSDPGGFMMRLRRMLADAAARGLLDHPTAQTQGEAMMEALLLGERNDLGRATNEAFRRTGLLHILSLSGMHMGVLILAVWGICRVAGLRRPARALVCIGVTVVFLLTVPIKAPILRAAIVVWVYCLAVLLRRYTRPLNSLSFAALAVLLWRPTQLFDAGWQLSFAGVAGILELAPRLEAFAVDQIHTWRRTSHRERGPSRSGAGKVGRWAIQALSVGMAAWLASAGLLLYHFHNLTPLAGVWTILASFCVTPIVVLGFVKILLSLLLPTAGLLLGWVVSAFASGLIALVKVMARIDCSYLLIGHVPLPLIVLWYILILFAVFVPLRRPLLKRGLCAALALLLILPLGVMKWQRTHRGGLSLTCLDVGHGQAILARLPGTANFLFDAGALYGKDIGTRIVLPCMDYLGIDRLDALVASHHDVDHINGLPEVAGFRRVGRAYLGDTFFPPAPGAATAGLLIRCLAQSGIPPQCVPQTIGTGPARMCVLWPVGEPNDRARLSENDSSLVCLIEFAGRRVLLCSDIEKTAQQEILRLYPSLRADVVVAPHHGSTRTLNDDFLRRLGPSWVICSCSRSDYESGRILRSADPARLVHTAEVGAITIAIDRAGRVRVQPTVMRK